MIGCDAGETRMLIGGESSAGESVQIFPGERARERSQAVARSNGGRRASLSLVCSCGVFGPWLLGGGRRAKLPGGCQSDVPSTMVKRGRRERLRVWLFVVLMRKKKEDRKRGRG